MYPVIAEPPFAGATQLITTLVPEIVVVGATGAKGIVGIIAPLPEVDAAEIPIRFVAITVA